MSDKQNGVNICNFTIDGEEYYDGGVFKDALTGIGAVFSIPFILFSICCTCILSLIFSFFGYNSYSNSKKYTAGVIVAIILGICCLSSFIGSVINYYNSKKDFEDLEKKTLEKKNSFESIKNRPCYSTNLRTVVT